MYEVNDVYVHVVDSLVSFLIEVFRYLIVVLLFGEIKMFLESIHDSSFCLAYILYAACFTSDAVYYVTALARNVIFRYVCSARVIQVILPVLSSLGQYLQVL